MPHAQDISVIIPTWERLDVLPRALDSVLAQTAPPGEIILVDDGSTDGTAAYVETNYPAVKVIRRENGGVSAARNTGLEAANGIWIALLDSDDAWVPTKLAEQLAALESHAGFRLCHTEEIWIRNGVRVNQMKKHAKAGGNLFERCLELCCISPSSVLIHRDIFDDYGLFDEMLPACEDYDLWLRVCAGEEVLFVDTPLTIKHGGHEDQLSRRYWGMDRFRVEAIEKLLRSGVLEASQTELALRSIIRRLEILIGGAKKRSNSDAIALFEPKLSHWRHQLSVQGDTP